MSENSNDADSGVISTETENNINDDVCRLRRIVSKMLCLLEREMAGQGPSAKIESLFGSKETALSVLTKLSQILLKLHPGTEITGNNKYGENDNYELTEIDMQIIAEFVETNKSVDFEEDNQE